MSNDVGTSFEIDTADASELSSASNSIEDFPKNDGGQRPSTGDQSSASDDSSTGESSTSDETLLGAECMPGNTQTVDCGLNSRGEQTQACFQGLWVDDEDCDDLDECHDEDERSGECVDGHGAADQLCVHGQWVNESCTLQTIYRASVSQAGEEADDVSSDASLSEDGRMIAFASDATNLVSNDTNERRDVFVRDLLTGTTEIVSLAADGGLADDRSSSPRISADGRFVVFASLATNLVSNTTSGEQELFVRDLVNGTTTIVSVASEGGAADDYSLEPSISASGRFVAFTSYATNLVSGDTNGRADIFLRDMLTNSTSLISLGRNDAPADDSSSSSSVTEDGRYVAFSSSATNLVLGDTNDVTDVFVRAVTSAATVRVHMPIAGGDTEDGSSVAPRISADGRRVTFASNATNLVSNDTNNTQDIFVTDLTTNGTSIVSVGINGESAGSSSAPTISADGRFVAFASSAANLVSNDINEVQDIFVRDLENNTTIRASVDREGVDSDGSSNAPTLSADGRFVVFDSGASNLGSEDMNGLRDIFVTIVPQ